MVINGSGTIFSFILTTYPSLRLTNNLLWQPLGSLHLDMYVIIESVDHTTVRSEVYDIGRGFENKPEANIVAESLGTDRVITGVLLRLSIDIVEEESKWI